MSKPSSFFKDISQDSFQLVFGDNTKTSGEHVQRRKIAQVKKHPKYKKRGFSFNLALVKVDRPVKLFADEVMPVNLPCRGQKM